MSWSFYGDCMRSSLVVQASRNSYNAIHRPSHQSCRAIPLLVPAIAICSCQVLSILDMSFQMHAHRNTDRHVFNLVRVTSQRPAVTQQFSPNAMKGIAGAHGRLHIGSQQVIICQAGAAWVRCRADCMEQHDLQQARIHASA